MTDYARFLAYGNQLVETHAQLRAMLDDIRDGLVPEASLPVHCLAFCRALSAHHTGEDREVFPELAARHPELRSFLDDLARDHEIIAGYLDRIQARGGAVGSELDELTAMLETHFRGEEKRLVGVLNALDSSVGLTPLTDALETQ